MEPYDEFENVYVKGIHISRYVASWVKYKDLKYIELFEAWLKTLIIDGEKLSEEEIMRISNFAENGKLELECSVKKFLGNKTQDELKAIVLKEIRNGKEAAE